MIKKNIYINALENSFQLLCEANKRKSNPKYIFFPFSWTYSKRRFLVQVVFSTGVLFLFPVIPLLSRFNGLWFFCNGSQRVFFDCSHKSHYLLMQMMNGGQDYLVISTSKNTNAKQSLGFRGYWIYLKSTIAFFRKYVFHYWYYPALLQIPNLINLYHLLQEIKPVEIVFTNHFDRWTSIILQYCNDYKSQSCLVQHGVENHATFFPSKKFDKVTKIICYNQLQEAIFREKLFKKIGSIEYFCPKIILAKIDSDIPSVLVVGHGDKEMLSEEINVIKNLLSLKKLIVYVKPHPVNGTLESYDLFTSDYYRLINEKDYYPDVNYLLHSGSTLAIEYEMSSANVKVLDLRDYEQIVIHI